MASIDGVLQTVLPDGWYKDASYKVQGAVLRGVKAGLSVTAGILLAAATAGTLLPVGTAPYVVALVTLTLQSVDKFIREWNLEKEGEEPPLTDEVPGDNPVPLPPVVIEPEPEPPVVVVPEEPEVPAEEPEPDVVPEEEDQSPEETEIPSPEVVPQDGDALPELPELPVDEVIPLPEDPDDTTGGKLM